MGRRATLFAVLASITLGGAPAWAQSSTRSADGLWQTVAAERLPAGARRPDLVGPHTIVQLDRAALDNRLANAPLETAQNRAAAGVAVTMALPLPDGRFSTFRIEESPILAPELAAVFPDIRTYRGIGVDDATATARLDLTRTGVHVQVLAAGGTVYVDPLAGSDPSLHVAFDKQSRTPSATWQDDVLDATDGLALRTYDQFPITHGTTLRTYRLALAATGEYTVAAGGTKPLALSRMTTTMNRVNGILEREIAVRLTMATGTGADPTALIYTDGATDPYTNNSGSTMLGQNQSTIDSIVGSGNYDMGHVFSTGGGGVAYLQSVCNSALKAQGVTGLPNPTGDTFAVDYVSHEMGHQFGANHTFNSSQSNCGANRSIAHAFEVGSGITIMSYSGLCAPENIGYDSVDRYDVESLNEMTAFVSNGGGATCGVATATGNAVPVVSGPGAAFTIPARTPFQLTATATDANNDGLTYTWEEHDRNNLSTANAWGTDDGLSVLFRSYASTTSPTRTFPSLSYILNNNNVPPSTTSCSGTTCITGEMLPTTTRTMNFIVTVRDNRAGGSALATSTTQVQVNAALGPFAVVTPNIATTMPGLSRQAVTWSVNGTDAIAANVAILFSSDGGVTFPYTLAASTPNDGSETVTLPSVLTTTGRIKIQAVGNIFFDISNANLVLTAPVSGSSQGDFDGDRKTDVAVYRPSEGKWYVRNSVNGSLTSTQWGWPTDVPVEGDYDGDGRVDLAVWRPSTGTWYILNSSNNAVSAVQWGWPTDTPHPGDYDGDGRTDMAVYRPSTGTWYIRNSTNLSVTVQQWGWASDQPVPADYDGDSKVDIAVFRPSTATWYILGSTGSISVTQWGWSSDRPVAGDYDGDGRADIAVWRPNDGTWYIRNSTTQGLTSIQWGWSTDTPVVGDFDGDGRNDAAVFRSSTATWYIRNSATGTTSSYQWGLTGDLPLQTPLP